MTNRPARPTWWQLAVVVAAAVAAIVFVVRVATGVLADGAGTGDPADFYGALAREATDATTWTVMVVGALIAAVVTAVATLLTRRR